MKIKDILSEEPSALTIGPADSTLQQAKDAQGNVVATGSTDALNALKAATDKGVTLGNPADQTQQTQEETGDETKKVFKHHGKPVGEIGIDPEASPGGGNWYVKHYASGHDTVGFDSAEEAMAELKYIVKHHMEENQDLISQGNQDVGGDATDNFIDQVRDKDFERAQGQGGERSGRDERSAGILSPISEDDALLEKMRMIAGLR